MESRAPLVSRGLTTIPPPPVFAARPRETLLAGQPSPFCKTRLIESMSETTLRWTSVRATSSMLWTARMAAAMVEQPRGLLISADARVISADAGVIRAAYRALVVDLVEIGRK